MNRNSMRQCIFEKILILGISVIVLISLISMIVLLKYAEKEEFKQLKSEALLISQAMELGSENGVSKLSTGNRITWIDKDGTVLFDNYVNASVMENHSNREEILEAYRYGEGSAVRYSNTLKYQTLYYAIRNDDGTILRLAVDKNIVKNSIVNVFILFIVVMIIFVIVSIFLALNLSKVIVKPINSIDLEKPDIKKVYIELKPLIEKINNQNITIQKQILKLELKQEETKAVALKQKKKLVEEMSKDSMTKLYNKKAFIRKINEYLSGEGKNIEHALLFTDIDDFKSINDNFGHKEGDRIIKHFTAAIKRTFNESDVIGRFGGDEFVIFAKNYGSVNELNKLVDKIFTLINDNKHLKCRYSVSIGVALYPNHGTSCGELLQNADEAMYGSKKSGKNTSKYYGL